MSPDRPTDLPLDASVGYQVRVTHRALQRYLQSKIEPHGVTLGMWYFLRVLWTEDGLTQRELSRRVGTMEPTTLAAILQMERSGLVTRVRGTTDRRRQHIHLTDKGREIGARLLPLAVEVVETATAGLSPREVAFLLDLLRTVRANLEARLDSAGETEHARIPSPPAGEGVGAKRRRMRGAGERLDVGSPPHPTSADAEATFSRKGRRGAQS